MLSIFVTGTGGSGKSALCLRYIHNKYITKYDPTIEDSYSLQREIDGKSVAVEIFDTAGQEEYDATLSVSLRRAHCVLIVIAWDNRKSLDLAPRYIQRAREASDKSKSLPIILVRSKGDLDDRYKIITESELESFCSEHDIGYRIDTSASTSDGVNECFQLAIRLAQNYYNSLHTVPPTRNRSGSISGLLGRRQDSIASISSNGSSHIENIGNGQDRGCVLL